MLDQLSAVLSEYDISAPIEWNTNKPTRSGSQWFVGKHFQLNDKDFYEAWFGDYKRDIKKHWSSTKEWRDDEKSVAKKHTEAALEMERVEREKVQEETAIECATEFETFATTGDTPYTRRKNIAGELYGARIKANDQGDPILVVPLRDTSGKLWNFQRIYAQKLSKGDKFFAEGARIEGLFHCLRKNGDLLPETPPARIYICEGFATALSIQLSLKESAANSIVVSAFNANNLQHVATALKARYGSGTTTYTICADNDAYTIISGKPVNVGLIKGRRAAGAIGATICYPVFKHPGKGLTDFNDLHAGEGLEIVRDQLENFHKYVHGIQPMCLTVTKNGKTIPPTEKEVCDFVLSYYGDKIIRQDKSLFLYKQTHWVELDPMGEDIFKQKIQVAANGQLGSRDLHNYLQYIKIHAPQVPKGYDLFQPNPFTANFLNGTLHIYRNGDKKYHVKFRAHDATDYLTSVLPFNCPSWQPGEALPAAPLFDGMIDTLWANNEDKKEIKKLIYELVGGALMPAFPSITFFYGKPNSGKSTIIKLLVKLVSQQNVSNVQPCDFVGFNMETMVGKLVNFDTDIDTNKPFSDSEIKKIIDRVPRRIRRKGRTDVTGFLPAMHLFAGNQLPKTLDGNSHAYERRITIIKTESFNAPVESQFDFEQEVLNEEMEAIVARGLMGIHFLAEQNGKYIRLESSNKLVREFEAPSDVVGQFIEDVRDGEVRDKNNIVKVGPELEIERKNLWELFQNWQSDSLPNREHIGKVTFFNSLKRQGFELKNSMSYRRYLGLGVIVQKDSIS